MITSPHNPKLKQVRALLGRPKARREAGLFVAEGIRLVEEALNTGWPFAYALWSAELSPRGQALVEQLRAAGVPVEEVSPPLLRAVSDTETTQGVLAALELPPPLPLLPQGWTFLLIPDQIRDPGNLGTLIRAAAAAGADAVLIPPETTDPWAPKVVRAGMGAHFRLRVAGCGWDDIRTLTQDFAIFLADARGALPLWKADFRQNTALILGGEAEGASPQARMLAKTVVNIPMPGKIESLNAGTAGAILLFEVVRQRNEAA